MSDQGEAAGFWSYATEDNRLDGGAILDLATAIKQEFNLIASQPLNLFVDRNSVEWGDEWRRRIDIALTGAAFFIPIITPRYFTRPECRRELLDFYGKAKSLNLERLIFPISYIDVDDLKENSSDEAIAIVARVQHADWRTLRLEGPASAGYRKAVHSLAKRLHQIEREAVEIQLARELDLKAVEEPGLQDLVQEIDSALPDWLKAVLGDKVNSAQMRATYDQHQNHLNKLRARRSPRSAILATQLRYGPDMLPLAERFRADAQAYMSRSSQLNPLIIKLWRHLENHPGSESLASHIFDGIAEAIENILEPAMKSGRTYLASVAHLSQTLQKVKQIYAQADVFAQQGNDIVAGWWNMGVGELFEGRDFRPLKRVATDYGWDWERTDAYAANEAPDIERSLALHPDPSANFIQDSEI
ncbi:TIR domain-containing protein [Micromonospora chokoriensis]